MKLDLQEKLGNIDVKSVFSGFSPLFGSRLSYYSVSKPSI